MEWQREFRKMAGITRAETEKPSYSFRLFDVTCYSNLKYTALDGTSLTKRQTEQNWSDLTDA